MARKRTNYAKKSDMWNWDGSMNHAPHWRTQMDVVDDFGNLIRVRRCASCRHWLLACEENFHAIERRPSGHVARWLSWCRPCERERKRERKRKMTPEQRRAEYEKTYAAIKADPERYARMKEGHRRAAERWRKTEGYRESKRRYKRRVQADPKRREAYNENQRMAYRLRRERKGLPVKDPGPIPGHAGPEIPLGPLFAAVEALRERLGIRIEGSGDEYVMFCERLGVSDRTLREWRQDKRNMVRLSTADQILTGVGWNWFDVYCKPANGHKSGRPEDVLRYIDEAEPYIAACLAFEGELVE